MITLNRQVYVWSNPLGTVAIPEASTPQEIRRRDDDLPPIESPEEVSSVRFCGVFQAGTPVDDVVDIGAHNRVRCTIEGQRVTTVKWALSE